MFLYILVFLKTFFKRSLFNSSHTSCFESTDTTILFRVSDFYVLEFCILLFFLPWQSYSCMEKLQLTLRVTAGFPSSWKDCCSLGFPGDYSGLEILSLNWS